MSSEPIYHFEPDHQEVPAGLHLIAGLTGFTDAGGVLNQFSEHIFANLETAQVLHFDNDELLDYRSRRPVMFFEKDHIEDYEPASLALYLVHDEVNQPFLFLHGYEPDFRWDAFTDAVLRLIKRLQVKDVTWLHSIPFPIPHTRETGVTVSGNRMDIVNQLSEWKPRLRSLETFCTSWNLKLPKLVFQLLVTFCCARTIWQITTFRKQQFQHLSWFRLQQDLSFQPMI